VTVDYTTVGGSAAESVDYDLQSGRLTFAPGVTERTIAVSVLSDTLIEGHEEFLVSLSAPTNAQIARIHGVGTILDDERPVIAATLAVAANTATISWNALAGLTYRVQYKSDLQEAGWTILSGDVVATGPTASKTHHAVGLATQRFYRVVWVP
jgi:hypothetical protein